VTRVEEWTKAATGVGAAIAAGNQADRGTCALFVILANTTIVQKIIFSEELENPKVLKLNVPFLAI
jgi:hypothetical protein